MVHLGATLADDAGVVAALVGARQTRNQLACLFVLVSKMPGKLVRQGEQHGNESLLIVWLHPQDVA